ncbi:D-lyxose/D-mannose family sugar isomerase [Pelagicoccus mobilis]|uniref:D-lyxose ketol-isomerase n=1 Tax=Pelagicoccus mobilis TaxID=415221 RepID=A0A934RSA6_9BACT|nr:D-lyxose/D-mannose family sugar isomerase [Pelagicoccus mobilis]MBK1875488.1 D-lyxose/D-mannose family sugar isomerase [Pelagicoccus mobilis]
MNRSQINRVFKQASECFKQHHWHLPPNPSWDVTDFGLGDFDRTGLTLINLSEEPEYCEKLMYARQGQTTPAHTHARKKEDIICRVGELTLQLWDGLPEKSEGNEFTIQVNQRPRTHRSGDELHLLSGERVTLQPGIYHSFWPTSSECIIGEVSTANDDTNDNIFVDPKIGRYPGIEEDEPALVHLISE